jgi:VanZ family protein
MHKELILFIAAACAVFCGCLLPKRWLPALPNDKLLHFAAFGVLALLAGRMADTKTELIAWLAGLLLAGLIIEGLQSHVPGRAFCWRDMAANTAGVFLALLGARALIGV